MAKESTLYYFYSQGCGFCKKIDPIVEKLNEGDYNILKLDVSEEDNAGLKRELENKYDLRCGTPWLVDASNGNHICGATQEENIKKWASGEKIPEPPKPKSPAPLFPVNESTEDKLKEWTKKYNEWVKENNHLPNLQTAEQVIERFKQQKSQKNSLEGRITSIEQKLNKLMNHLGVK